LDLERLIEEVVVNLLRLAVTELPRDVKEALQRAYSKERSEMGKIQLGAILDNIRLAEERGIPLCQDTGLISFYLKAGSQFGCLKETERIIRKAVARATVEVPLRPNALDPITQENTGNNIGRYVPYIHWRIVEGDFLEITALPKGGGSENTSALSMLSPAEGLDGSKRFILESVVKAGGMPCPPTIIGVGIGGGADIAVSLAKTALLRPLDEPHPNPAVARLEEELLEAVNKTGVGPMGLGGDSTALAVRIEYAHRHPASYPVAVVFQCWAARRATARIYADGDVECLSHAGRSLL